MNRVLFVDDEALILNSLKRGLMGEPYEMLFASSGQEALKIMEEKEVSVLVTDMKMPGMSGLDLLRAVKEPYPDLVKLVLSGYTQLPQVLITVNQGDIFKFITKPWDLEEELKGIIRESVDYFNYRVEIRKARAVLEKKNVTFQNILKTYDDKMISMRDELGFMRDMNKKWLQQVMRRVVLWNPKTETKDRLLEDMVRSQALITEAFGLIPVQVKRFSTKMIPEELRKWLKDTKHLMRIEFGIDSQSAVLVKGRYDLLLFLIKNLLVWTFADDAKLHMIISGEAVDEQGYMLTTVIEAEDRWLLQGEISENVTRWLSEWAAGYGGELVVKDLGGHRALILKMLCDA